MEKMGNENIEEQNALVIAEQSSITEIQSALIIAKKFERNEFKAIERINKACQRIGLAQKATYTYPRGGEVVSGPSIRLVEVLAQNWGNLDFGWKEIEKRDGSSLIEAYCWDLETNTKQKRTFEVAHKIQYKNGGSKTLTDPRDIYEINANMASRRIRACVLGVIPADVTEEAVKKCRETLAKGNGEPLIDRIRKMVISFSAIGVNLEMLEEKLGHGVELTTGDEFVSMVEIYNAILNKEARRQDFFKFENQEEESDAVVKLREKMASAPQEVAKGPLESVDKELKEENTDVAFTALLTALEAKKLSHDWLSQFIELKYLKGTERTINPVEILELTGIIKGKSVDDLNFEMAEMKAQNELKNVGQGKSKKPK